MILISGRQLYNNGDFYHTILWMYETKKRFHLYEQEQQKQQQLEKQSNQINRKNITTNDINDICSKDRACTSKQTNTKSPLIMTTKYVDILEYLAFSIYMEGNLQIAIDLTKELLQLAPDHSRAKGNLVFYENKIKELEKEHDNKIKSDHKQRKRGEDENAIEDNHKRSTLDIYLNEEVSCYFRLFKDTMINLTFILSYPYFNVSEKNTV